MRLKARLLVPSWMLLAGLASATSALAQAVDPRGPIAAYGDRVQVTKLGVALTGGEPWGGKHGVSASQIPWKPDWITIPDAGNSRVLAIRLRKEITLPAGQPVQSAVALVSADPFYRLWVNGVLVSRGPDDAGNDYSPHDRWSHRWLANRLDIARYLHPGVNVLAAEVFQIHRDFSLGTMAFAFRMSIAGNSGSQSMEVESGPDWMVENPTAYVEGPILQSQPPRRQSTNGLHYDARLEEADWRDAGFAGSGWSPAKVIPSIWGPVAISDLPPMMEAVWPIERVSAVQGQPAPDVESTSAQTAAGAMRPIVFPGNGSFLIDYDRVLSGYISLEAEGTPGTSVTVWARELRSDSPGRRPFQVTLSKGVTRFESPELESFSTLEIDVSNATGPVHFHDIRANFVSQPVAYRGSFTSSDEGLNIVWKAARWQTQICLQSRFMDSPDHQEPIGDPGDYLIEAGVADYAFGPVALTPQFLREFAGILDNWMANHPNGSPNFHTSYSLLWLQTLMDYYDQTGDEALLRELAPSAYRLLARYAQWIGPNGILSEAPNYLFMDWVTIGGFPTHHPPAVIGQGYLTAFYYRGLADGQRLAQLTGDTKRVADYATQRSALREAFNRELWDAKAGLYRDGKPFLNHNPTSPNFLPPDRDIETHSPHVNALAVLYDLAPHEQQAKILARMLAPDASSGAKSAEGQTPDPLSLLNVQPYFMHFVFAAEAHAGVFGLYAPAQMARWVVNPQTQTFQEMWTHGDWSHGWGATPLIQMSSHVLGVSPSTPGYATVLFAPVALGLTFAKGTVPTPRGDVLVSWTRDSGRFAYEATLPAGTTGLLDLDGIDGARSMRVSVDGSAAKPYAAPISLQAGAHRILLSSGAP